MVLFVLLFILTWYTNLVTREKKTKRKSPIQQLVLSSGRGRERVPKLPERSDDPFALPCGERIEGERIDASVVDIKTNRRSVPIGKLLLKAKRTGACSRAVFLAAGCLVRLSCTGLKAKGSVRAQN